MGLESLVVPNKSMGRTNGPFGSAATPEKGVDSKNNTVNKTTPVFRNFIFFLLNCYMGLVDKVDKIPSMDTFRFQEAGVSIRHKNLYSCDSLKRCQLKILHCKCI